MNVIWLNLDDNRPVVVQLTEQDAARVRELALIPLLSFTEQNADELMAIFDRSTKVPMPFVVSGPGVSWTEEL